MRNYRVLIIDDSLTIRAMVEELLATRANCTQIAVAPDVPTARKLIAEFKPSLITLDLNLPGIDGLSFLDELRASAHAPVVVLSSATIADSAASEEAIAHGADACFDKSKIIADTARFIKILKRTATDQQKARARLIECQWGTAKPA
jgi:two-component system chemotaxis response regulator CheB